MAGIQVCEELEFGGDWLFFLHTCHACLGFLVVVSGATGSTRKAKVQSLNPNPKP